MAQTKTKYCPGCGRHCPLEHPKCKYGRNYAEKLLRKVEKAEESKCETACFKWEKYVQKDSPVWSLLYVSKSIKKNLCKKKTTEEELLAALTEEEKRALTAALKKLEAKSGSHKA